MTKTHESAKTTKSHSSHVHTTHEGETPMKTSKKTHAATDSTTANEGATTMTSHEKTTTKAATAPLTHPTSGSPVTAEAAPATPTASTASTASTTSTEPAPSYVALCSAALSEFDAKFPKAPAISVTTKKHMSKARKGSERYTPKLVALAKSHGVSLASVPLDTITSASAEATALVPLMEQMERMYARLQLRSFSLQSTSWGGSSKLYAVLKRLSKDDVELKQGLEAVEQYFSSRHPSVAAEHPKTKKGKEALAAKKAAEAGAVTSEGGGATAPVATAPAVPTGTPAAPTAAATSPVAHS